MSGGGNDFVIIDVREKSLDDIRGFVAKICRRGISVGADGVILVERSSKADYAWHYYNADGGEASMCGNGLRCVARFAYLNKIAPAKHTIETSVGIMYGEVLPNATATAKVQLINPTDLRLHLPIPIDGIIHEGHFVNTGVPHVVYFVEKDALNTIDLIKLGRATRYHSLFAPAGTNANFVHVVDAHSIKIRTYERGVEDETLACGTGSTAAAVIATALQKTVSPLRIETRSGTVLGVDFKHDGSTFTDVHLEGDARLIYKGELSEEALL